ncbi:unnamed protein product [Spirodela intermedia]|uniref:Uncharacterized protein n=1 Tax=Spirodela intermedia TaxID=51605 RepID=A0A7I8IRV3_SPIIN|nr:unnamed protein product [Spirodela intermedia]CAA6660721.1 unnamed protein product [Spirodela intermedia]
MGDSTAMTIEFLRARLLSERSVSRSARQRADQLAKRVLELEEQLRVVTFQRKQAEKAANEVLSILESQGINDFSEVMDSWSDQENAPDEGKCCNENCGENLKDDEASMASIMDGGEVEDGMSGSEVNISPSQGGGLSWKSRANSSDSLDKRKEDQARRRQRRNFISRIGSSPQLHLGKSCRKIKTSVDMRREKENAGSEASQTELTSDCPDDEVQLSKEINDVVQERVDENCLRPSENQKGDLDVDPLANGFGRDEAMEAAIEQQDQLIVQYMAEENAQREWEQKYENPCEQKEKMIDATQDKNAPVVDADEPFSYKETICEPQGEPIGSAYETDAPAEEDTLSRNQLTEGSNEEDSILQEDPTSPSGETHTDMTPAAAAAVGISASDARPPPVHAGKMMTDQRGNGTAAGGSKAGLEESEFHDSPTGPAETREQRCPEPIGGKDEDSKSLLFLEEPAGNESSPSSSPSRGGAFKGEEWSLVQNPIHRGLTDPPRDGAGNVLGALQRARLMLRQELSRFEAPPPPPHPWAEPAPLALGPGGDSVGIPFGPAALFRLPSDVSLKAESHGLGMSSSLQPYGRFGEGFTTVSTHTESRTSVTASVSRSLAGRTTAPPPFTARYSSSAAMADLAAGTASYGELPSSFYAGGASSGGYSRSLDRPRR